MISVTDKITSLTVGGITVESQRVEDLYKSLEEIISTVDKQVVSKLEIDKCKRIINRLSSFSTECEVCYQHFTDLEKHVTTLKDKKSELTADDIKHHKQFVSNISSHLQKHHKLVPSGYYLGIYMSIGTSLGIVFGLVLFDNIALGLPLGIGIGVAIGSGLDADVKKKGLSL